MSVSATSRVCAAMQRIAPLALAGSWDNVGLLLEAPAASPAANNRVLLTIDLTTAVCDEAIALKIHTLIAYHPPLFAPLKSFTLATPLQKSLLRCAAAGISVYSPHSALDAVWGGLTDWLASIVSGAPSMQTPLFPPSTPDAPGAEGRRVDLATPTPMSELVHRVKSGLGLASVQVGYSPLRADRLVRSVAICAGSGASVFAKLTTPADVWFTGEMQHHELLAALANGTHVILCGHTNTERGFLPMLADRLRAELRAEGKEEEEGDVEILVSEADRHPLEVV
ncbi:hypothetical protein MKEN_00631200 [Mycena kentingensis (nom. inval.)]|nr:hypothetical protein MKEN_00631200 [Mycena kentingensis (nom. inval.)]